MKVRILVTGGTFDKDYDEIGGKLYFAETRVPEMLALGRCGLEVEVQTLMLIDSLDMTDADRRRIVEACQATPSDRIVITHGTDTMELTARALGQAALAKTIVLTGAMIPYTFGSSDGLFNLGSALAFAQSLPAGTYVAMNGRYFLWNNVRKNRELGFFEEVGEPG
jgi:L-asparaginase